MARSRSVWLQWYRTDIDLHDHPKTIELASAGKWDREIAVARLHRLWSWIARRCPAGDAVGLMASGLEQHMRDAQWQAKIAWDACRHAEIPEKNPWDMDHFDLEHGALHPFVVSGFLEPITSGYRVHDWYSMNGRQLREVQRSSQRAEARKDRGLSAGYPKGTAVDGDGDGDGDGTDSGSDSVPRITRSPDQDSDFETLWKAYPHYERRSSKAKSRKRWTSIKQKPDIADVLIALYACAHSDDWTRDGGRFVPACEVWIGKQGWDSSNGARPATAADGGPPESAEAREARWRKEGIL